MSVQRRGKSYRVRWEDPPGKWHSRTFLRSRDAEAFDADIVRRRRLGTLADLDAGTETLDEYVIDTWAKIYAPLLKPKTRSLYASLYDGHIAPQLGSVQLRKITPELIGRWQADRLCSGAGRSAVDKSLTLLGNILQRAFEGGHITTNPQRRVRRAKLPKRPEVRPLAPRTIETMRQFSSPRDAALLSVLAYAGLRPGEALALRWGDVRERTLLIERAISVGEVSSTKTGETRSVRLLGPLASDLRGWRMRSGRPEDSELIFPGHDGEPWTEPAYQSWRRRSFRRALAAAAIEHARPYDLRHSFASLLLHEGRSVIYVARQLGHDARLTLSTYGHVITELDDAPREDAEAVILSARAGSAAPQLPIPVVDEA